MRARYLLVSIAVIAAVAAWPRVVADRVGSGVHRVYLAIPPAPEPVPEPPAAPSADVLVRLVPQLVPEQLPEPEPEAAITAEVTPSPIPHPPAADPSLKPAAAFPPPPRRPRDIPQRIGRADLPLAPAPPAMPVVPVDAELLPPPGAPVAGLRHRGVEIASRRAVPPQR